MQAMPMIIAAAGTAMQMSAQQHAEKERRTTLNRQLERNEKASDKSMQLVEETGKSYDPAGRAEGLQQQEAQVYDQTQRDLQSGAGGAMVDTSAGAGAMSGDFLKASAQKAIDEGTRLTSIAREAAKARAPGALRMNDSLDMAGLTGKLQNVWGTARNMAGANALAVGAVKEPAYGALGKIAASIGSGMSGGGASGGGGISWGGS